MTKPWQILATTACITGVLAAAQPPGWITKPGDKSVSYIEGQSGPVTGRAFSATEMRHTVQTLADGTRVERSDTSTFERDDYGRMRNANDQTIVIFDPVAGFTYVIDPHAKTYQKHPVPANLQSFSVAVAGNRTSIASSSGDSRGHRSVRAQAMESVELPPQDINGISAKGSRITLTIAAGSFGNDRDLKVVNERWYSDDLQVLLKSSNSDPRFGVTTYELTSIVQAAPDPALFLVPADYRLMEAR